MSFARGGTRLLATGILQCMAQTPEELVGGLAFGAGGGDGGSGVWLGPTRWILPAQSDTAPNLLTVTLEAGGGGRVKQLAAQGRRVPLARPLQGPTTPLLAHQLERTALCVGDCTPDHVAFALSQGSDLRDHVEELDSGAADWNDVIVSGMAFQAAGAAKFQWRSTIHEMSRKVTQTLRAVDCVGVVLAASGARFQANCVACHKFGREKVKRKMRTARGAAAEMATEAGAAARKKRRMASTINTKYLTEEEVKHKAAKANSKLQAAERRADRANEALRLYKEEATVVSDDLNDDLTKIITDPGCKAKVMEEFGDDDEEMSMTGILFADHAKYEKLSRDGKETGMRWHPKVRTCQIVCPRLPPPALSAAAAVSP